MYKFIIFFVTLTQICHPAFAGGSELVLDDRRVQESFRDNTDSVPSVAEAGGEVSPLLSQVDPVTHPSAVATMTSKVLQKFIALSQSAMKNFQRQELIIRPKGWTGTVQLQLGKQYGAGFFGQVYGVESMVANPPIALVLNDEDMQEYLGPIVIKMGHIPKHLWKKQIRYSRTAIKGEALAYEALTRIRDQINEKLKGRLTAWGAHQIPVVPILKMKQREGSDVFNILKTTMGPFLFKPVISGKSPDKMRDMDEISSEMIDGIDDILAYVRAVDAVYREVYGTQFYTDLRPPNLVWIEDPETLDKIGYSKAGWMLYEQDTFPTDRYVRINRESYLKEIFTYFRKS